MNYEDSKTIAANAAIDLYKKYEEDENFVQSFGCGEIFAAWLAGKKMHEAVEALKAEQEKLSIALSVDNLRINSDDLPNELVMDDE